jgi:drug/metabolite transporter (DMT)-like permease
MYQYVTPVVGVVLAAVLLGERITPFLVVGGVLILTGVGLATTGRSRGPVPPSGKRPVSVATSAPGT